MSKTIKIEGTCRRCRAAVSEEVSGPPVYRCMPECNRCEYKTIIRDDPIILPLRESLEPYLRDSDIEDILGDLSDPFDACSRTINALLLKAVEQIEENRTIAIAGILHLINDLDGIMAEVFTDPHYSKAGTSNVDLVFKNITCQLLYQLIAYGGPVTLPAENVEVETVSKIVGQQIFPMISNIAALAKMVRPALFEQKMDLRIVEGKVLQIKLPKYVLALESGINMLLQEKKESSDPDSKAKRSILDEMLSEPARRAITLTTGIKLEDLLQIFSNKMSLLIDQGVGVQRGNLVMIPHQHLNDEYGEMFRKLCLSQEKLLRHRSPCFFDTGPLRSDGEDLLNVIAESGAVNWVAYYPCYEFCSPANGSTIYVTTPRHWQGFLMALPQCKAYLLHQLEETYHSTLPPSKVKELREYIRATHHELEEEAANRASLSGWHCLTAVEMLDNRLLPCGEIDLLAAIVIGNAAVLIVGEVKNTDNALFKIGGLDRIQQLIDHAEKQLTKKGDWVAENWEKAIGLFETSELTTVERRYVARLVITARPVGTHFFKDFNGCSIKGLQSLTSSLKEGDPQDWQNDWEVHLQEVD